MFYVLSGNNFLCGAVMVVGMRVRWWSEGATVAVNLTCLSPSTDQSHYASLDRGFGTADILNCDCVCDLTHTHTHTHTHKDQKSEIRRSRKMLLLE